jgi:decaprenylphospho-beta-D-erythro-pentofuranosid-2-ulose 2-reductase
VVLAGRDPEALDAAAKELEVAGADDVSTLHFDALDFASHGSVVAEAFERAGEVDLVLVAFGVLGDQELAEQDAVEALRIVESNYSASVSALVPVARRLRAQGHGTIVVLSSVAGERARKANFVYGSSKAGLDAFCQGLGDSLVGTGVRVVVVRPGFVHTKMTEGMPAAPLSTTPDAVGAAIVAALGRGDEVVWVPRPLRLVMSAIRHLPRPVFRKLPL